MNRSLLALALALASGCARDGEGRTLGAPPTTSSAQTASAALGSSVAESAPAPSGSARAADETPYLEKVLRADDPRWTDWLANAEATRLQILVTVPHSDRPWETYALRADAEYVYPASAIKPFLAVAALRALDEQLEAEQVLGTKIRRCRPRKPGCEPLPEDEDKDAGGGDDDPDSTKKKHKKLFVGDELAKMLSYSDNDSYNRLYDIVGHAELNAWMAKLGFPEVRIHHRMSAPAERSRDTPRVILQPPRHKSFEEKARTSTFDPAPTPAPRLEIGEAYKDGGKLVKSPLDFSKKNFASLRDLQRIMIALVFPEHATDTPLALPEEQRQHLLRAMTVQVGAGRGAAEQGPLSPGVADVVDAKRVRYIAKSGRAYGFHLENAYIEDRESGRSFFVTAVVYANPDGVLNDDDYAYEELSKPLLAALGRALARALLTQP
ncbi:MAG: serine hydrolase [Polyangiaceae bacterium]